MLAINSILDFPVVHDFWLGETMAPAITSASSSEHGGNKATVINGVPTFVPRNRLTALLADGDKSCRMMQKGMLRYYGVQTQDVSNGKAVVDLLASASTFDLIVIDIVLPVVNGLEVTVV